MLDSARARAEEAATAAADIAGELRSASAGLARAQDAASRSAELSADEDCPMCGQELGDAFEQVQAHRRAEVDAARAQVATLEKAQRSAAKEQAAAKKAAEAAQRELRAAQQAWSAWQATAARRSSAEESLAAARAALGAPPEEGELDRLGLEVERGKSAAAELQRLEGRVERAGAVAEELAALGARIDELTAAADDLRARVKALGFDKEALETARSRRDAARKQADALGQQAQDRKVAAAKADGDVETAKTLLAAGEERHAELAALVEDVRHTARVAELLAEFRNTVVQSVGPLLAAQAAELFAELTDHEYDTLDVDPETYEIKITDAGTVHGLARFSGSETDLANLALRIAISEHVRFQSGGAVGLLVLDEVFGPLDPERKERMLLALERLRARFRQVLVITHDEAIKEQLPSAIEVVKLPGRRATARVLSGV